MDEEFIRAIPIALRGKNWERRAKIFVVLALVVYSLGVVFLSQRTVVSFVIFMVATVIGLGGAMSWYISRSTYRRFMQKGPWSEEENLIQAVRTRLEDIQAQSPYQLIYADSEFTKVNELQQYLEAHDEQSDAKSLKRAMTELILEDKIRRLELALITIKESHDRRWQRERDTWEKLWQDV